MKVLRIRSGLALMISCCTCTRYAQSYTISGTIRDAGIGEELIGVPILIKELPGVGTVCNEYGFYSMTLTVGAYTLTVAYVGYQDKIIPYIVHTTSSVEYQYGKWSPTSEVVVMAQRENENITKAQMGLEKLDVRQIGFPF